MSVASSALAVPAPGFKTKKNAISKLGYSNKAANPMVGAATPVLSLLERLNEASQLPDIVVIRENLAHELHAFYNRLQESDYNREQILAAYYLLSATADEIIGKNYLKLNGEPVNFQALTPASFDEEGPEKRFFDIVTYIKNRANNYLELLELAYYCLSTGFEGKLHAKAEGRQTLDALIDELYGLVSLHRVRKPHRLFKTEPKAEVPDKINKPLLTAMLGTLVLIIGVYLTTSNLLGHKLEQLAFSQQLHSGIALNNG